MTFDGGHGAGRACSETTVILVDDDPRFAREVAAAIDPSWSLRWIDGSDQALETIRAASPRWILLDLNMPRLLSRLDEEEGLAVLQRLSTEERRDVVIVTSSITERLRRRIEHMGVHAIYLKSQPIATLRALLETEGAPWPHR